MGQDVYTVGHSNRSLREFLSLLGEFEVEIVVDIRRFPTSRKYPHFDGEVLKESLRKAGMKYDWIEELGGYRGKVRGESRHTSLKPGGFRNYADYLSTEEFQSGFGRLKAHIEMRRAVCMCAERLYFKCHRFILSDYLVVKGFRVLHIIGSGRVREHSLSNFARVVNSELIYDV